jgi:hypothetical protein
MIKKLFITILISFLIIQESLSIDEIFFMNFFKPLKMTEVKLLWDSILKITILILKIKLLVNSIGDSLMDEGLNMNNDDIFDEVTKRYGGRFHLKQNQFLSSLLIETRKIGLDIIEDLRKNNSKLPDIHINFIDNKSFNAYSFKNNDSYYIGINKGTILNLYSFFNYSLSFPNVLSYIGNNENEIEPDFNINNLKEIIKPKDKQREIYAEGLFYFATLFLILHEYAHIINGHLDFINKKTNFIFKIVNSLGKKSELNSQTLEFDADRYAANIVIKNIINRYQNNLNLQEDIQPYFQSLEEAFFLWTFATYTVFRFLGKNEYNFEKLDKYPHPYPGFRQHYTSALIPTIIKDSEYSNLNESILKKTSTAVKEFEDSLKIIKKHPIVPDYIDPINPIQINHTYTKKGLYQIYKIQNNWRNMRPLLKPFSKVNLAPIIDINEEKLMK